MSNRHHTNLFISLCLLVNTAMPVFAQDDEKKPEPTIMTSNGPTSWILKGNKIYFLKWD